MAIIALLNWKWNHNPNAPGSANGMDAPTRNGINVPKWKCLSTT